MQIEEKNDELAVLEPFALVERLENIDLATIEKYEVQDKALVQRLGQALPEVGKILNNHKKAGEQLYKLNIPLKQLVEAKGEVGKYRAIVIKDGKIAQHAKLVPVQAGQAGAAVANVMAVAAVAVGQYYMAEIDQQLRHINTSLNKIKDFQEQEFKGKICSLLKNIAALAQFSEEYVLSERVVQWKLNDLSSFRKQAMDLLEQVNGMLEVYDDKSKNLDFKTYQIMLLELYNLLSFQDVLLQILKEIARLEQVLLQGEVSLSSSYHLYKSCNEEINDRNPKILAWQNHYSKKFKINLDKKYRKQEGVLGVIVDAAKELDRNAKKAGAIAAAVALAPVGGLAVFGGAKLAGELHKQIAHVPLEKSVITAIQSIHKLASKKKISQVPDYQSQVQLIVDGDKIY